MSPSPEVTVIRRLGFAAPHPVHGTARPLRCTLEVSVTGTVDPATGYVVDFALLRRLMEELVARLPGLADPPTAENTVVACWRELAPRMAPARLSAVRVWETSNQGADYRGD